MTRIAVLIALGFAAAPACASPFAAPQPMPPGFPITDPAAPPLPDCPTAGCAPRET